MYYIFPIKEKEMKKREGERGQDYNTTLLKSEKALYKKKSCGANKFMMTQQVQETVH